MFLCSDISTEGLGPPELGSSRTYTHTSSPEATPGAFRPYTAVGIHGARCFYLPPDRQHLGGSPALWTKDQEDLKGCWESAEANHTHCPLTQLCHLNMKKC